MGIEIRPSGESTAYAAAGQTIGKAERGKEERARGERQTQQAQDLAARQRADQMAMDWELQKMQMRSQLDFQQELRDKQYEYDKFNRAKEWEVEKMGLASRFDFEQEEKERLRTNAMYDAAKETLEDNKKNMGDAEYEKALFELDSIYAPKGVIKAVTGLGFRPQEAGLFDFGKDKTPPPPGVSTTNNPLGLNIENIPANQLPQAVLSLETQNKFEVISPDGNTETIDAVQWPDYKERGYILSQIKKLREGKNRLAPLGGKFYGGIAQ